MGSPIMHICRIQDVGKVELNLGSTSLIILVQELMHKLKVAILPDPRGYLVRYNLEMDGLALRSKKKALKNPMQPHLLHGGATLLTIAATPT